MFWLWLGNIAPYFNTQTLIFCPEIFAFLVIYVHKFIIYDLFININIRISITEFKQMNCSILTAIIWALTHVISKTYITLLKNTETK